MTSETLSASANALPRTEPDPGRLRSLTWLRRGLWLFAAAAAAGAVAMTLANEGLAGLETPYGLKFLVGLAFAGSGLYAWGRRPENRLGPLMTAVGCVYLLAQILVQAHASSLFTAGIWLSDAWVVLFVVFLLAFPDGRINARFDLVVIGMFALMAFPLELAWLLFWTTGGSPENALAAWPNATVAGNIDSAQRAVVVLASVVLAITLARRWLLASPPLRRALVPILVGSVGILLGSVLVALDKFQIEFPTVQWAVFVAYVAIPLVVLGGILRSRLARSTVGDLFVELRTDPSPTELRDALARTLRDPSLSLAYWLPQFRSWSDLDGRPVAAARGGRRPGGDDDRPQRGARGGPGPRSRAGRRARAARRSQRGGRDRNRERALARRATGAAGGAAGIAFADHRGRTEGAAAPGAQPPRRRPAAADRPLARAEPARAGAGTRGRRRVAAGAGEARDRHLARRAARGSARDSPSRRQRTRAGGRSRAAHGACALARSPDRRHRRTPAGADRGRGVLPRVREPHERRETLRRLVRRRRRQPDERTGRRRDPRRRSRRGGHRSAARGCAASRTGSRRWAETSGSGARAVAAHGYRAEIPCAS